MTCTIKAILHYALDLRFGKIYEQNTGKTRAQHEQNKSKTRAKREQNATDSRFCPTHIVINNHFLVLGSSFGFFLHFSRFFTHVLDANMLVSKMLEEKREGKHEVK